MRQELKGMFIGALLMAGTGMLAVAADQPSRRVCPADGVITIRDYGYRDWPNALVQYAVPAGQLKAGPVCLTGADNKAVPAQIDGDTLAFVASLAKGATATYKIGNGQPAASSLSVKETGEAVEIGNEFFALRLPPAGKKDFAPPAAADKVPGPIAAWKPKDGQWMGATRFVCTRQITGMESKIIRNGPAVFEYETRYRFGPEGEYVCRVTVVPGMEYAAIAEEYDFGVRTEGKDFLLVEMSRGFTPGSFAFVAGEQNDQFQRQAYQPFIDTQTKNNVNKPAPVGGQGETPMPPQPEADMVLLDKILPAGRWGGTKGGVEIGGAFTDAKTAPANPISVVPMHAGSWRRALAMTTWYKPDTGIVVALPVSTRKCTWYAEVTDDISPFSTHEHDRGLPESYGRREWGLCFGDAPQKLQGTSGYIGLDRYKDWILDWPETAKPADYPRSMFTRSQVERLKKSLDQHPDKEAFSKFFVFSGKKEDAIEHAKQATQGLVGQFNYLSNWNVPGLSHYRQTQSLAPYAPLADDALACPDLPKEARNDLRRTLAVAAYLISDPDLNPRGAGVHLGNNNMPLNRTCILPICAAMLPDHPLYAYWMKQGTDFVRYKLETYITPDGTALEPGMYQLYGPLRFLSDAVTSIRNSGGPDLSKPLIENGKYLANLTMPDARYDGRRIIPGMGNSGNFIDSCYGFLIADAERLEPEIAGRLQSVYRSAWPTEPLGSRIMNHIGMAFRYLPDVPASKKPMTTEIFPTYGVAFRAHSGTPNETAMLFRVGNNWGHWDTDPLNVILYGQGAPLSPGTGYQYYGGPLSDDNAIYHDRVKVGAYNQTEIFGRVDNEIRDYGFGPSADYAVAARYYPPEAFNDKGGELWWNRHVMLLKSPQPAGPSYFVMRDTFTSKEPRTTWWTWLNLEGADKISVEGQPFKAEDYPVNKKIPADKLTARDGQAVELQTDFGASTWFWFADKRSFRPRVTVNYDVNNSARLGLDKMFPKLPGIETKTALEAIGQPGQDFFYVVYPRAKGAPVPTVSKLADGVLKIVTSEATDYVFVSDTPLAFNQDGVEFTGKAGAVRVFADRVALCMNSGSGKIGYKGCIASGNGPFEKVVPTGDLKSGETKIDGGYEKKWQTVEIGDGLTVRGEAPFTAKLDGKMISIATEGRARQIFVTKPKWMDWVDYRIDSEGRMACWTDYPSSGWGSYKNTALIALTVPEGKHGLEIKNLVYPAVWTAPFVPGIKQK